MSARNFVRNINGIEVEFWITKPFEEISEIILECDNGDEYVFYAEEPIFGPEGYRVIVNADSDTDSDIMAVVKSVEDIMRFVLEYVDAEELRARGVTWIDATIR